MVFFPVTGVSHTRAAESLPKCRAADDYTAALTYELKRYVSSQDPKVIADRDSIYHVPVVPVNQISVVTDERVCSKVVQAYSAMSGGYTPSSLYVIKMGSKYTVAVDPDHKSGEFNVVHIFNSNYADIGGWVGG